MTEDEREHAAAVVRQALEEMRTVGEAKKAALQKGHLTPRTPARLSPQQLNASYRREGLRNPHRTTLKVVA